MLYKTIVLELPRERPALHERLRASRTPLSTMNRYETELKAGHESWMEQLGLERPGERSEPDRERGDGAGLAGTDGAFADRVLAGRGGAVARRGAGVSPTSHADRVNGTRTAQQRFVFGGSTARRDPPATETPPNGHGMTAPPAAVGSPSIVPLASSTSPPPEPLSDGAPATIAIGNAGGEKAKARDIIAAIRTLQSVEREHRRPTSNERQALARFGGFGAVALALFPNPVILKKQPNHEFGGYRDASWRKLGDELQSLLTPAEYESARATVRYAYYTSPIVMQAMHAALERLGVPADATVLEPGCGIGNFMAHAAEGMRFIGVEMDGLSGRIARASIPRPTSASKTFAIPNYRLLTR